MNDSCATRFPLVFLHGLAYRDNMHCIASWGRIPDRLAAAGAQVYLGELEAFGSIEENAQRLCTRVAAVLAATGATKINLIAHSKGGLEARFAVSRLSLANSVASITTLNTPHRGTVIADIAGALTSAPLLSPSAAIDLFARMMGDRTPQSALAVRELTREALKTFNREVPDHPGVYCQSFGTAMRRAADDPLFALSFEILRRHDGENDGMVPTTSCRWGTFRGIVPTRRHEEGISHLQITDFRQTAVAGVDIPQLYVDIVRDLRERGY